MIRYKDIEDAMLHVVGWEQSMKPSEMIGENMLVSESGLTMQSAHPLMTIGNMAAMLPTDWISQYKTWKPETKYYTGDKCTIGGYVWMAIQDNIGNEPPYSDFNGDYSVHDFGSSYWRAWNAVTDYIERITRRGTTTAISHFLTLKKMNKETRNLLERRTAFDGAGRLSATIDNQHKVCGIEIQPVRGMGVTAQIERVGLQFSAPCDVTLYLFRSGCAEPVHRYTAEYSKSNGTFMWVNLPGWYLPYIGEYGVGGSYYLVYSQDQIAESNFQSNAIEVSKDWSCEPCGTCNIGSVEAWRELSKYVMLSPFCVQKETNWESNPLLWDIQNMIYTNTRNYGLNIEVSVSCDLTDTIIKNKIIFAEVLQKQIAYTALKTMYMNPDVAVNRKQSNVMKQDIIFELDGSAATKKSGLGIDLEECYKALDIDTKDMDRICLSCNNKGVKYRGM